MIIKPIVRPHCSFISKNSRKYEKKRINDSYMGSEVRRKDLKALQRASPTAKEVRKLALKNLRITPWCMWKDKFNKYLAKLALLCRSTRVTTPLELNGTHRANSKPNRCLKLTAQDKNAKLVKLDNYIFSPQSHHLLARFNFKYLSKLKVSLDIPEDDNINVAKSLACVNSLTHSSNTFRPQNFTLELRIPKATIINLRKIIAAKVLNNTGLTQLKLCYAGESQEENQIIQKVIVAELCRNVDNFASLKHLELSSSFVFAKLDEEKQGFEEENKQTMLNLMSIELWRLGELPQLESLRISYIMDGAENITNMYDNDQLVPGERFLDLNKEDLAKLKIEKVI